MQTRGAVRQSRRGAGRPGDRPREARHAAVPRRGRRRSSAAQFGVPYVQGLPGEGQGVDLLEYLRPFSRRGGVAARQLRRGVRRGRRALRLVARAARPRAAPHPLRRARARQRRGGGPQAASLGRRRVERRRVGEGHQGRRRRSPRSSRRSGMRMYDLPDARGHFGPYGGVFVAETLSRCARRAARRLRARAQRSRVQAEFELRAQALRRAPEPGLLCKATDRKCGGAAIYIKREDLNHTGAHKINNTIGQALLARNMKQAARHRRDRRRHARRRHRDRRRALRHGVRRLHGHRGREAPGGERATAWSVLGAKVVPVESGSKTLKDALNEAMRDWVTNVDSTFYIIGTVAGPHPYPMMVRDFQTVIGEECIAQMPELAGRQPDAVIACVGGGSNAMGIFYPYIAHAKVQADRRRGGGRRPRDRQARGVAVRRQAGRAARQPHLPAAGRERPDHRDAFGLGGPRLSRRRARSTPG